MRSVEQEERVTLLDQMIKVDIDGEITISLSNKQLSKYSENEIKLII